MRRRWSPTWVSAAASGCSSYSTASVHSGRVHGVEVSDTMLSQAARRYRRDVAAGRLALHTGSLTQLPFADSALDGVLTVNTIYFIAELNCAFTELARVVGSAGRIVVGVADPDAMARMPFTGHGFPPPSGARGDRRAAQRGACASNTVESARLTMRPTC